MSPPRLSVVDNINLVQFEKQVIKDWRRIDAFHTQNKLREGKPRWSFYDGPPFATGTPHYGHILASTIKDIMCRDAVMNDYYVERRFGWDTHGLPIEYEIDKKLGIKGPEDVKKMGIRAYNAECRKIVSLYSGKWEETIERLGRWIDFKNDYKTMYPTFMESVWWVFKQLFDKGLVYKGVKVMPYSTGCCTPLSNFEANQNYKEVQDPAVVVNFPLVDEPDVSILAWTTTPWTLPTNLATCVHPDLIYVKLLDKKQNKKFIMMEQRIIQMFKNEEENEILQKMKGIELKGKEYVPLFNYFKHYKQQGAFRILCDKYVTTDAGTGIVHQSPFNGEDDYRIAVREGYIKKDGEVVCPMDDTGRFTSQVPEFEGMYIKDADKEIVKYLKEAGRLESYNRVNHNYPFCWRSDSPLIYKAVGSWFVRVEEYRDEMLASNSKTYWVPDSIKEGRFKNWLANARDWAISRSRYWGTPIPIWTNADMSEIVAIGSIAELEKLSGQKITDLHRENIDHITIPSSVPGNPPLTRIPEVFDCWFESGSMPYAQCHYPFENKKVFEDTFPADFIAEGVDQCRGWFYTLTVLGTHLFGKSPFKNLIVNGLVLAEDGNKMSKRKKNYTDPNILIDIHGADAIRLYLINSPIVKAEDLRFRDSGVREIVKNVFIPWFNVYKYLLQKVNQYEQDSGKEFRLTKENLNKVDNYIDRWILSELGTLIKFVDQEMKAYRLYTVIPQLIKFIDTLSKWYVKLIRDRLRTDDAEIILTTLTQILYVLCRRMACFTPFITETMFQGLKPIISEDILNENENVDSIHYLLVPSPTEIGSKIDKNIERAMNALQTIITLVRITREQKQIPGRQPLNEIIILNEDQNVLNDINMLQSYLKDECNIHNIKTTTDKAKYGITRKALGDYLKLGKRLRKDAKPIYTLIANLTDAEIEKVLNEGGITLNGHYISKDEIRIQYNTSAHERYETNKNREMFILLDTQITPELKEEFISREIIKLIQMSKQAANLIPTDQVHVVLCDLTKNKLIEKIGNCFHGDISSHIRSGFSTKNIDIDGRVSVYKTDTKIIDSKVSLEIFGQPELANRMMGDLPFVNVNGTFHFTENPKGVKLSVPNNAGDNQTKPSIITVHHNDQQFYLFKNNFYNNKQINLTKENFLENLESLILSPDLRKSNTKVYQDEGKKKILVDFDNVPDKVYV